MNIGRINAELFLNETIEELADAAFDYGCQIDSPQEEIAASRYSQALIKLEGSIRILTEWKYTDSQKATPEK